MLEVRVLGGLSAAVDGRPVALPSDARARELLAWLVVAPGPHPRSALAGRLRPDVGEDSARQTLRNAVYELRRALGPAGRDAVNAGRDQVGLAEGAVRCDLWEFRRLVAAGELEAAVEQGAGELLAGLDADWVLRARDEHTQALGEALAALAAAAEAAGDPRAAAAWVRRRLELEPLAEDAHRTLIRLLALAGDRPAALAAAAALGERLRRELGVPVSGETRALVEDVRRGRLAPARAAGAALPLPLPAPLARTDRPEGREPALERLAADWRAALAGGLRVALVAGEPGIGKTTLAGELARRVRDGEGAAVLYGRSDEQSLVPYQPWVEALDRLLDALPQAEAGHWLTLHDGALARLLPARSAGMAPAEAARERYLAFEAVRGLLEATAAHRPLLLVLDDVHWADPDSLALLRHVTRTALRARALVLLCARSGELAGAAADTVGDLRRDAPLADVALSGLDEPAVAALLARRGAAGTADAAAYLRRTGGNPYFLAELLRDEEERGAPAPSPPPAIRDVVGRRVARLSDGAAGALAAAAVLGLEFAAEDVARVDGTAPLALLEALDEAVAAGLVVPAGPRGRFAFAHALVPETVVAGLGGARRAQLHLQVAEHLLERRPAPAGEVAGHLRAAGPLVAAERRVAWGLAAAEEALAAFAYADAAAHYEAALEELGSGRTPHLLALGDALDRAGDRHRARAAFAEAARLAREDGDAPAQAHAALGHGGLAVVIAAPDPATVGLLEAALERVGAEDPATAARLRARLAVELHYADPARADELSRSAVAAARASADHAALAAALNARRVSLWAPAHVEARLRLVDEMVGATAAADTREAELQARSWRVIDLWELGRLADVRTEVAAYEALADRVALPHYRWYVPLWRAGLAIVEGRWAAVEELAAEALRLGREADDPNAGLFVGIQRRVALVDQGRVGGIDRDEVLREASASAAPGAWLSWVANLDALAGRMDLARAALRRLVASGDWPAMDLNWHAACELSDSAALVGDRDAAAVLHERMAPHAHLFPVVARGITSHGCAEQYVGRLAAVLGRLDEAEARLREAVLANRRAGARPGAATSLVHLGGVLGARGDAAAAREALAEGRAEAEALDMAALAATAAAGLRDLDDAAPR